MEAPRRSRFTGFVEIGHPAPPASVPPKKLFEERLLDATGEKIDEKAARIIGWNGLLLGLFVTAASFAVEHQRGAELGPGSGGSVFAESPHIRLVCGPDRATEYRVGLEPADLLKATQYDVDEGAHIAVALGGYSEAHDANKRSLDRSSRDFTWALVAFLAALLLATASAALFLWHGGTS